MKYATHKVTKTVNERINPSKHISEQTILKKAREAGIEPIGRNAEGYIFGEEEVNQIVALFAPEKEQLGIDLALESVHTGITLPSEVLKDLRERPLAKSNKNTTKVTVSYIKSGKPGDKQAYVANFTFTPISISRICGSCDRIIIVCSKNRIYFAPGEGDYKAYSLKLSRREESKNVYVRTSDEKVKGFVKKYHKQSFDVLFENNCAYIQASNEKSY